MPVDRELRSSKRQRIEQIGTLDVSIVKSDSSEPVTNCKRPKMDSELSNMRISDGKTHKHIENMDSAKESEKISPEASEDNIRQLSCKSGANERDSTKDTMDASSFKKDRYKGSNEASSELFPEQNEKLASTLLSLKGMDGSAPKIESFPKADHDQLLDSKVSGAATNCLDSDICNEKALEVNELHNIELELLAKFKKNIELRGGTIEDGWKVQATRGIKCIYKVYLSPDGRRFRSMKEVQRSLGILPKSKRLIAMQTNLDNAEANVDNTSTSVHLNANSPQSQQVSGNLGSDQISKGTASLVKESGKRHGLSTPPVIQHEPQQPELLVEGKVQPSSGLLTMGLKDKSIPDTSKASVLSDGTKKRKNMHWAETLEKVLKTSNMSAGGIRNQIFKAVASDPPEWVKQVLQPLIATDAPIPSGSGPVKEAVLSVLKQYRDEEVSCKQTTKETPVSVQETGKTDEGIIENESGRKISGQKAIPPSEVITERCRNVFQDITKAENFADLCTLIHGTFTGSRTHEVFDFPLIEVRMKAGTYGLSPGLFYSDMQQIWKRVRDIGQEMINLAESLTQYSQASYKKQVSSLIEGEAEGNCNITRTDITTRASISGALLDHDVLDQQPQEIIDCCHSSKQTDKMMRTSRAEEGCNPCISLSNMQADAHSREVASCVETTDLPNISRNLHLSNKGTLTMENVEGCVNGCVENKQDKLPNVRDMGSSANQVRCTSCGSNERNDCIILCNACQTAYHRYCLSPAPDEIPTTGWYCVSCSLARNKSSEVYSFCDKDNMVNDGVDISLQNCVVSELQSGQIAVHSTGENDEPEHCKAGLECNRKDVGPNIDGEVIEIYRDEGSDLHRSEREMTTHTSRQEAEEHDDKQLVEKLCKICSTGKKDDDHLIECSNENCLYKFYHLRCLRPPLASVPPPTWFCPSCLCRSCFIDEHDEDIILCDGCDDGYHTYCLNPPLAGVPESNWYCPSCLERQKRRKRKKGQNHAASASKSAGQVHSKKVSQVQSQLSLHTERARDLSGRLTGSAGRVQLKKAAQVVSPSSLHLGGEPPDVSEKIIKHEMENFVPLMQSEKPSQSNCPVEEEETKGHSDGSLEGTTDNFIVRVRPKHTTKYGASVESKEAGKRKRKCSEPKRSQV